MFVDICNTDRRYNIIYCDPPWPNQDAKRHYQTLRLAHIASLPIERLAKTNCALLLWSIHLPDALMVMTAWGFEFKTVAFNWFKRKSTVRASEDDLESEDFNSGRGGYTRQASELCLLGIKGQMGRCNGDVKQVIAEPIRAHSRKPDQVRHRIVRLFGNLPRIELFARQETFGFDVWGDECTKFQEVT